MIELLGISVNGETWGYVTYQPKSYDSLTNIWVNPEDLQITQLLDLDSELNPTNRFIQVEEPSTSNILFAIDRELFASPAWIAFNGNSFELITIDQYF